MNYETHTIFYTARAYGVDKKQTNVKITSDDIEYYKKRASVKLCINNHIYYCFHSNCYRNIAKGIAEFAQEVLMFSDQSYGAILFRTDNNGNPAPFEPTDTVLSKITEIIDNFKF
jgi:hypothetical protein